MISTCHQASPRIFITALSLFRVALDALEHRNVTKIDGVFERLVGFVTCLAFAV